MWFYNFNDKGKLIFSKFITNVKSYTVINNIYSIYLNNGDVLITEIKHKHSVLFNSI